MSKRDSPQRDSEFQARLLAVYRGLAEIVIEGYDPRVDAPATDPVPEIPPDMRERLRENVGERMFVSMYFRWTHELWRVFERTGSLAKAHTAVREIAESDYRMIVKLRQWIH